MPNKALHLTVIPLRSIAAGELGRWEFRRKKYLPWLVVAHNPRAATAFGIRRNHFAGPHLASPSIPSPPTPDGLRVSFGRPLSTAVWITTMSLLKFGLSSWNGTSS